MLVSKKRQAGSAVTFIIIAVILAALTVGGVAFVVQRGEQARQDASADKLAEKEAADKAVEDAKNEDKETPAPAAPSTPEAPAVPQTDDEELPVTGPEDDLARTLVAALLVGTMTSFVLSRRAFKRSL